MRIISKEPALSSPYLVTVKNLKLLVIDDNKDLTEAICDGLESPDIECKIINGGRSGLDEILNQRENTIWFYLISRCQNLVDSVFSRD